MSEAVSATFTTLFERSRYSSRRWWGLDEDDPARKQLMDHSAKPEGPRLRFEFRRHSSNRRKLSALKRIKRRLTNAGIHRVTEGEWTLEVNCKPEDSPGDME